MSVNPASDLDALQSRIDDMLRRGRTLAAIEEMIDATPALSEEQKSALWLYGWAQLPRGEARREARQMLADFA